MKVTLKQIAEHSGVSMPTVSEILNDKGVYSQQTRKKVLTVARDLGYRPNASARAMQSGKFNTVTWLSSTHAGARFMTSPLLDGVLHALDAQQMQLHIARVNDSKLTDPDYLPSALRHLSCDGLLIDYTKDIPPRFWELVQETRLPAVWINSKQRYDSVYPDDVTASKEMTQALQAMGHRHIGYLTPPMIADHYSYADRCQGYRNAMKEAGLKNHVIEHGRIPGSQLRQAVSELVKKNAQITAWISYSDTAAIHICEALEHMGHTVGKTHHVATVGAGISVQHVFFEHYPILHTPHIWETVGQKAVEMLIKKVSQPQKRQTSKAVHLPYQL
ncbi:MAG: LacI family DNA-binding transcriptional regulator [Phycisphaeraceae bacterium JB051]